MKTRTVAIALGVALGLSVAGNLFAATATWSMLNNERRMEHRDDRREGDRRPSPRELVQRLGSDRREPVREALRTAGLRTRPDFQAAREARRAAVTAAAATPYDGARVSTLMQQAREAENRGREKLETDTLAILATLSPADRAAFAPILNSRGKSKKNERPAETPSR